MATHHGRHSSSLGRRLSNAIGKLHKGKHHESASNSGKPPNPDDDPQSRAALDDDLSDLTRGLTKDLLNNLRSQLTTYTVSGLILAPLDARPTAILDAGCGACQWASEVAQSYPEAIVHAVDITDADIPIASSDGYTPLKRVKFFLQDLTASFPPDWAEKFDVVNVRHVFRDLQEASWDPALRNLMKVLKPGGWIQIVDFGAYLPETQALGRLSRLNRHVMRLEGYAPEKIPSLSSRLHKAGFRAVRADTKECIMGENNPVHKFRKASIDIMLPDLLRAKKKGNLAGKGVKIEGQEELFPKTEKEYNDLLLVSLRQLQSTKRQVHIVVAQKPSRVESRGD